MNPKYLYLCAKLHDVIQVVVAIGSLDWGSDVSGTATMLRNCIMRYVIAQNNVYHKLL